MVGRGESRKGHRKAWSRVVGAGPLPWIVAALLIGASTVAVTFVSPGSTRLEPTSYATVAGQLANNQTLLVSDADRDGLADALENYAYGSDPAKWNSSGSAIPDGWLASWGFDPLDPSVAGRPFAAPPADRLPEVYKGAWPSRYTPTLLDVYRFARPLNWTEEEQGPFRNGIDPRQWDGNGDGLPDGWLLANGIDPREPGLPGRQLAGPDGLTVLQAFQNNTNPGALDSDRDGLSDVAELSGRGTVGGVAVSFQPTDPSLHSTAGTGVCDGFLVRHGLDPHDPKDALGDKDNDGATTLAEFNWSAAAGKADPCVSGGLDPRDATTAGGSIPDGWFLRFGLDPLDPAASSRTTGESPAVPAQGPFPGLPAFRLRAEDEYRANRPPAWSEDKDGPWWGGSDPTRADTDGDGLSDAGELQGWTVNATLVPGSPQGRAQHVTSDPRQDDSDRDGLRDGGERANRTHPQQRDTDFDGIDDGAEIALDAQLAGPEPADNRTRLDPARADSVGDLLRDGARLGLIANRTAAIRAGDPYPFPGPGASARSFEDVARRMLELFPDAALAGSAGSADSLAELFGPAGDLDGDGQPNLLDADMDDDDLGNGLEAQPALYEDSPFGAGPYPAGRSATDPQHADTDGDQLLDGWEVLHGLPNDAARTMDPDPALADTDTDGTDDGAEDPDGDGARVPDADGSGTVKLQFPNLDEQTFGTLPHEKSSDGDGLLDGWKVYWAQYSGPRPNLPPELPQVGKDQRNVTVSTLRDETRWTAFPDRRLKEESAASVAGNLFELGVTLPWTFLRIQDNATNPYKADTDGDGMPDSWEAWHRTHPRPDAACGAPSTSISPVNSDGAADPDGDGLTSAQEYQADVRSDPLCADSDLGGLRDGQEVGSLSPMNPADDIGQGGGSGVDSDGDGLSDLDEANAKPASAQAPLKRLDPFSPDSDGDGLLDGRDIGTQAQPVPGWSQQARELLGLGIAFRRSTLANGSFAYVFLGEKTAAGAAISDPFVPDKRLGDGIPDGWVFVHSADAGDAECYTYGRPLWWDELVHGPWWGGGDPFDPFTENCAALHGVADRDRDGLADHPPSEDPIPAASHGNGFPLGEPFADDIATPTAQNRIAARERAQAIIDPVQELSYRKARLPYTGPSVTPLPSALSVSSVPGTLVRGESGAVAGRLTSAASGAGIPNATVVARIGGQDFGAAFTDATGHFTLPVSLVPAHSVGVPPKTILRGQTGGSADWETPIEDLTPGARSLVIRSYTTPQRTGAPAQAAAEAVHTVSVQWRGALALEVSPNARPGEPINVRVRETDAAQMALDDPVLVTWNGEQRRYNVTAGVADFVLAAPARPGPAVLRVETLPSPGVLKAWANATLAVREAASLTLSAEPARVDAGGRLAVTGMAFVPSGPLPAVPVALRLDPPPGGPRQFANTTTDAQGLFSAAFDVPANAVPGLYVVSASVSAGPGQAEAGGTDTVTVRGRTLLSDGSRPQLPPSGDRTIEATLFDAGGRGLPGRELVLRLDGVEQRAVTDTRGKASFPLQRPLESGVHLQEVVFAGDDTHSGSSLRRERTIQPATRLTLDVDDAFAGGTLRAVANLTDDAGNRLAGRGIVLTLADGVGGAAVTDAAGSARFALPLPPSTRLGPTAAIARFSGGDGSHQPSEALAPLSIRLGAALDMPEGPFLVGKEAPAARLLDARGRPIENATVTVLSGSAARNVTTDAAGRIPLLENASLPGEPFDVPVQVEFPGSGRHTPAHASSVLAFRMPATLRLLQPVVVAGERGLVAVEVLDGAGRLLDDGVLTLQLDRARGDSAVFGGTARVPLEVPDGAPRGLRQMALRLEGERFAANETVPVQVLGRTVLQAFATPGASGQPLTVTVHANAGGTPLAGVPVVVFVAGQGNGFTATTSSDGKARVELAYPTAPTALQVRFAGSDQVTAASLATVLDPSQLAPASPLSKEGWLVLGGVAIALLLAAAAAVWIRRRSHPLLHALLTAERVLDADGPHQADVMACYATLQDQLVAAGVLRGPAPTPRSLGDALAKAVPLGAARGALDALLSIFESARYSSRAAGPEHRDQARDALRVLRRRLERQGIGAHGRAAQGAPA